jgi:hypothetical protein
MFRRVDLAVRVLGRPLLHRMPGRYAATERVWHQVRNEAVCAIVGLAERDELREKFSKYAWALEASPSPVCSLTEDQ